MLYNPSESHNILFSKEKKKKQTTGQNSSKFGICFKCPIKAEVDSLCGPDWELELMLHYIISGQTGLDKPADSKSGHLEVAFTL